MTDVAIVQHGDMICLTADAICLRRDMYNVRDISCEAICLNSANGNKKEAFDPLGSKASFNYELRIKKFLHRCSLCAETKRFACLS